jgi:LacI family transcriptional regulator
MQGRIALVTSDVFVRRLTPALSAFVRRRIDFRIVDIYRPARELVRSVSELRPIGIITESLPQLTERILALGFPTVIADSDDVVTGAVSLDVDDAGVGAEAAQCFLRAGHRHFACVLNQTPYAAQRWTGYERTLRAASGVESVAAFRQEERRVRYYMESWNQPADRLRRWLRRLPKPVAVFAAHDPLGRLVAEAALEEGLHVPEEVAIVGANNDELVCGLNYPPLSSVAIPWERIGILAGEWVLALAAGRKAPRRPVLVQPGPVVMRQSTSLQAVADPDLRRVMEYLRDHFRGPLTFGGVCRSLRISRRTVERKFAAHLRETPWECLTRMRVEAAKDLLLTTNLPLSLVAERSGFTDAEAFSRSFRRLTAETPGAFRRSRLGGG